MTRKPSHFAGTPHARLRRRCGASGFEHKLAYWQPDQNLFASKIMPCGNSVLSQRTKTLRLTLLATEQELSDFLKSVEKRAFKRSVYHVRNEDAALDIVQDSMIKLSVHYADKPAAELPMLFQRILQNTTLDYFRRQKTHRAVFSNMSDFESASDDGDFDLLETLELQDGSERTESAEKSVSRAQTLQEIDDAVQTLPARQREAFLMRYWEEMDVAETAAAMGCSEGSVKTHCSRAVQALSKVLKAKGVRL
jgi:RNA polymerase sigma-70 factor, ECF subfamily